MDQETPKQWKQLPERITFDQMTSAQPTADAPDLEVGRPAGTEFILRHGLTAL